MNVVTAPTRARVLYGTDAVAKAPRRLTAGSLSTVFEDGNLGAVHWGDREVIRGLAFIVRDTKWGTYVPAVGDLAVIEVDGRFDVTFSGSVESGDGDFRYRGRISGAASGELTFTASGQSEAGFTTCRAGFVVLHPISGVVGRRVEIEHASGGTSHTVFPELVDPAQPIFDIRQLTHEPLPGLRITVRLEGGTFEMEDQRNWTDASFKTYFRPVSWGFPYRIEPHETVDQSVSVTVRGTQVAGKSALAPRDLSIAIGNVSGRVPRMGLFLPATEVDNFDSAAPRVRHIAPAFILGRVDLRRADVATQLAALADAANAASSSLALEAVIRGVSPEAELAPLVLASKEYSADVESIVVFPERDLRSRAADKVPEGEADTATILAAVRRAFPGISIGSGTPCGFPEFNRNRPANGADFVTHSSQALYHAADDLSVMQTLETLPSVVRSVRAISGQSPYRIAPATIALPVGWSAGTIAHNPRLTRMTMAERDPRVGGLFGAAFALGYAAAAAELGVDALCLAAPTGPFGLFDKERALPTATVIAGLCVLSGRPRRAVRIEGAHAGDVAALAAETDRGTEIWLANLRDYGVSVHLASTGALRSTVMDAEALSRHASGAVPGGALAANTITLGAYALCHLVPA